MCTASSGTAAKTIAARLTGMEFDEVDDTVKDGIGEICNMLAGAWKGKVPNLAANCDLSVPAVITGMCRPSSFSCVANTSLKISHST